VTDAERPSELVAYRMQKAGCDVVQAAEGEEAVRLALEHPRALAILDAQELRARVQAILGRR